MQEYVFADGHQWRRLLSGLIFAYANRTCWLAIYATLATFPFDRVTRSAFPLLDTVLLTCENKQILRLSLSLSFFRLQCSGIEERSRTVELWSGVAQYCLLVGNYNSATAILESLESPAIARLKVTVSRLEDMRRIYVSINSILNQFSSSQNIK